MELNHLLEVGEDMIARLAEYEKRHRVMLPLDRRGHVVCTTCHNPRAKGVLRGMAALGAEVTYRWRVPSFAEPCAPCDGRMD